MARNDDRQACDVADGDGQLLARKRSVLRQTEADAWGNWEGKIAADAEDDSEPSDIRFVADLCILADQVGGTGLLAGTDIEVSISGTKIGGDVSLEVFIDYGDIAREPFVCSGTLACDESEISGTWQTICWTPDDCGCDGLHGPFELVRRD